MARTLKELETDILELNSDEKQSLLRILIADLDSSEEVNGEIERKWIIEAQRRYKELKNGIVESISAEEALRQARLPR